MVFKRIVAVVIWLLVTLTSAFGFMASELRIAPGDFFCESIDCTGSELLGTRDLCRENGWLNYDTLSGCSVATNNLRQPGLGSIALPRTKGLGATSTTDELLRTGAIPGREGVILNQKTVNFSDLWKISDNAGVEFALTREGGNYILRSGAANRVPIPQGVRPIVHTHPLNAAGVNSVLPSSADIRVLNNLWNLNPNGARPVSQIITGPNSTTIFRATGLQ